MRYALSGRHNNPFIPPWGTVNMETDEPIVTHCGKTVDPVRMPCFKDAEREIGRDVELREAAEIAGRLCKKRRARSNAEIIRAQAAKVQAKKDENWSGYEI